MRSKILFEQNDTHTHNCVRHARASIIDLDGRERLRVPNLWWSLSSFYMCLRVDCPSSTSIHSTLCSSLLLADDVCWLNKFHVILELELVLCRFMMVFCTFNILFHSLANGNRWKEKLNFRLLHPSFSSSSSALLSIRLFCLKTEIFLWWLEFNGKYDQLSVPPFSFLHFMCKHGHTLLWRKECQTERVKEIWQLVTLFNNLMCTHNKPT